MASALVVSRSCLASSAAAIRGAEGGASSDGV
jgi:hypothetical protein